MPEKGAPLENGCQPESRILLENGIFRHEPEVKESGDTASPDWAGIARQVLERASNLGFIRAGVASLEPFDEPVRRLEAFLAAGRHGSMHYLSHRQTDGSLTRSDPRFLLPTARCAIVVALPYNFGATSATAQNEIARYARGDDYHLVLRDKLLKLADEVARLARQAITARVCVDSAPLLERDLAVRAGFAFLGKNTLAIAPGAGSHFLLGELLLDAPLPPTGATQPQGCGSCTACLDACPTQAFVGPFELDATKCISYLTIESPSEIPRKLRDQIGSHLFGCDVCQAVCPFNVAAHKRRAAPELEARPATSNLSPEDALTMGSAAHKKLVKGSALRRVSRNQLARNAAIVLGNRGRPEDVSLLKIQAITHPSEQVRLHCVWSLGRLLHHHGLADAQKALTALTQADSPAVAREAHHALDSESFEKACGSHAAADAHGNEGIPPLDPV